MERIIVGHYADPNSLKDLRGITHQEHSVMLEAFNHLKKKYDMMLGWSDEILEKEIDRMIHSNDLTAYEKSFILDLTPDAFRNIMIGEVKIAKKLLEISMEYSPSIDDISCEQYRVLIDCIRFYAKDLDIVVNSEHADLKKIVEERSDIIKEMNPDQISKGMEKLNDEDVMDEFYEKYKLLCHILQEINTPLDSDAEHLGENENLSDTPQFFMTNNYSPNKTSVN